MAPLCFLLLAALLALYRRLRGTEHNTVLCQGCT
jgi:hypothetical protein